MCTYRTTLASGEGPVKEPSNGSSVGRIGGGAVAASIASELLADGTGLRLGAPLGGSGAPRLPVGVARVETVDALLAGGADLVVEPASHEAVRALGPAV